MNPESPVFVIDDEEAVRTSLAKLLRVFGFRSSAFESAEAFLSAYAGDRKGCLVVDIRMPGMSGLDLLEELERRHASLPAIVITGHGDPKTLQRLSGLPTIGVLQKPFSVVELKALLDQWRSTPDAAETP